jgi:hypothetical protein
MAPCDRFGRVPCVYVCLSSGDLFPLSFPIVMLSVLSFPRGILSFYSCTCLMEDCFISIHDKSLLSCVLLAGAGVLVYCVIQSFVVKKKCILCGSDFWTAAEIRCVGKTKRQNKKCSNQKDKNQ